MLPTLTRRADKPASKTTDKEAAVDRPAAVVLCVDDDSDIRAFCAAALSRHGFEIDEATNGRDALEKVKKNDYAAVLLDLSMPGLHGSTVLSVLQQQHPEVLNRVVVVTGVPDEAITDLYGSVHALLRKPINLRILVDIVKRCAASRELDPSAG
jgi:DNA-binding NtrC family response regulator